MRWKSLSNTTGLPMATHRDRSLGGLPRPSVPQRGDDQTRWLGSADAHGLHGRGGGSVRRVLLARRKVDRLPRRGSERRQLSTVQDAPRWKRPNPDRKVAFRASRQRLGFATRLVMDTPQQRRPPRVLPYMMLSYGARKVRRQAQTPSAVLRNGVRTRVSTLRGLSGSFRSPARMIEPAADLLGYRSALPFASRRFSTSRGFFADSNPQRSIGSIRVLLASDTRCRLRSFPDWVALSDWLELNLASPDPIR